MTAFLKAEVFEVGRLKKKKKLFSVETGPGFQTPLKLLSQLASTRISFPL